MDLHCQIWLAADQTVEAEWSTCSLGQELPTSTSLVVELDLRLYFLDKLPHYSDVLGSDLARCFRGLYAKRHR